MKAVFFDIDGTLVSFTAHRIPQSTVDAIKKSRENGFMVFIATGRPKAIINNLSQLESLNLIDGYITMNGGYTFVGDKVISKNPICRDDARKIIAYTRRLGVTNVYMPEHDISVYREGEDFRQIFYGTLDVSPIPQGEDGSEDLYMEKEVFQITTFLDGNQEKELLPELVSSEMARWHPAFVDITGKGNTKQKGIEAVCRHFQIDHKDTYAFGDGGNDISMLQYVHTGVAMGNAADDVKAAADYVTSHIDEDGVCRAMRELGVI